VKPIGANKRRLKKALNLPWTESRQAQAVSRFVKGRRVTGTKGFSADMALLALKLFAGGKLQPPTAKRTFRRQKV